MGICLKDLKKLVVFAIHAFCNRSIGGIMFWSTAFAQAADQAQQQPSFIESMFPMLLIFGVFYFLLIRPQTKRAKQHAELISKLNRGDEVITASGILGRIEGLTDEFVTLEVANNVRIKVLRKQIASKWDQNATAKEKRT